MQTNIMCEWPKIRKKHKLGQPVEDTKLEVKKWTCHLGTKITEPNLKDRNGREGSISLDANIDRWILYNSKKSNFFTKGAKLESNFRDSCSSR